MKELEELQKTIEQFHKDWAYFNAPDFKFESLKKTKIEQPVVKQHYWISYQIFDILNNRLLPPSEGVIHVHPFERFKSTKTSKFANGQF